MPVAIIVDNQTAAEPTIADLRNALTSLVTTLAGLGPVALVTTADRPTIVEDYTTDQGRLRDLGATCPPDARNSHASQEVAECYAAMTRQSTNSNISAS